MSMVVSLVLKASMTMSFQEQTEFHTAMLMKILMQ